MTYTVLVETLNPAQSNPIQALDLDVLAFTDSIHRFGQEEMKKKK